MSAVTQLLDFEIHLAETLGIMTKMYSMGYDRELKATSVLVVVKPFAEINGIPRHMPLDLIEPVLNSRFPPGHKIHIWKEAALGETASSPESSVDDLLIAVWHFPYLVQCNPAMKVLMLEDAVKWQKIEEIAKRGQIKITIGFVNGAAQITGMGMLED